jgi:pantoate--beta-alanine ligase
MFYRLRMIIFKTAVDLIKYIDNQLVEKKTIGFVPTMGALHQGHISLIASSKKHSNITIASIFVNPTQFNNANDFAKYPITTAQDIALLELADCDVLYLPSVQEVYPNGTENLNHYDLGAIETLLEGEFRPGHFQGVCNVLDNLFKVIKPHMVFMGLKDYQQCAVVAKLLQLTNSSTVLMPCETLREADGLAMSSRNTRLSADARAKAFTIHTCLQYLKNNFKQGDFNAHKNYCLELLANDFKTEYICLLNTNTWQIMDNYNTNIKMCALIATWLDGVRLIDNMLLD